MRIRPEEPDAVADEENILILERLRVRVRSDVLSQRELSAVTLDLVTGECCWKGPEESALAVVGVSVANFVERHIQFKSIVDNIESRSVKVIGINKKITSVRKLHQYMYVFV